MGTVYKFSKSKRPTPALPVDKAALKSSMPKASTVLGVLSWLWWIVRLPLFLVLYWLRLPIVFLCELISIPAFIAWLIAMYAFPDKTIMVWGFGIMSFGAFALTWFYDYILIILSPQQIIRTL